MGASYYLLERKTLRWLTWSAFSFSCVLFNFQKLLVICINDLLLLNAITNVAMNLSPNAILVFNICHCLLTISLIFAKVGLYFTENSLMFFRNVLALFNRADFSRFSTFSNWLQIFSLKYFSTIRLTKSFEWFLYSIKVEPARAIPNTWLYGTL